MIPTIAERVEPYLLEWLRRELPDVKFATRAPETSEDCVLILVDYLQKATDITQKANVRLTVYKQDPKLKVLDLDGAYKLMSDVQRSIMKHATTYPLVGAQVFTGTSRMRDDALKTDCLYAVMQVHVVAN